MSDLPGIDLKGTAEIYAVANTPLYLVRRLQNQPTVCRIAETLSEHEIVDLFEESLQRDPKNLEDVVRPYVFATALAVKRSEAGLDSLLRRPDLEKRDWLTYIVQFLKATLPAPVSLQQGTVTSGSPITVRGLSSTQTQTIIFPKGE